jgi:5-methylcytosine-specific restriction enzyme A
MTKKPKLRLTTLKPGIAMLDTSCTSSRRGGVESSQPRKPWYKTRDARTLTGRPWRRLREQILERDAHLCQRCRRKGQFTEAVAVDHVIPVAADGTNDPSNLESICDPCHIAKGLEDKKKFGFC